ncbi:MAG: hypothetical protein D6820_18020 [Lentisphaerae bacterium]|nr:MAG: hypothetical protein D6820_18020 [Lentisphaerota bacterium]
MNTVRQNREPEPNPEQKRQKHERLFLILFTGLTLIAVICAHMLGWLAPETTMLRGRGYLANEPPLFRFDARLYRDIAQHGYRAEASPTGPPTVVFFPLFPLLLRVTAWVTQLDMAWAGFLLNTLLLCGSALLFRRVVQAYLAPAAALLAWGGVLFNAGSFCLYSCYSEPAMLFFLLLSLYALQTNRERLTPLAMGILSSTRVTAFPFCLTGTMELFKHHWHRSRRTGCQPFSRGWWREWSVWLGKSLLCGAGLAGYLGWVWWHFSNPLILIPRLQQTHWKAFHPTPEVWKALSGWYLWKYIESAFHRSTPFFDDILSINLLVLLAGLVAAGYALWRFRDNMVWRFGFPAYFLLIYWANIGSIYLVSVHRHMTLMLPIYVGIAHLWMRGWEMRSQWKGLLLLFLASGLIAGEAALFVHCLLRFSLGWWYFF